MQATSKPKARKKVRVFVADDDPFIVEAMGGFLGEFSSFQIIGSAASAEETVEKLRSIPADLLLLDIFLAGQTRGLDVIATLKEIRPEMKILVITGQGEQYQQASLLRRANGFLVKPLTRGELVGAVATVLAGRLFYNADLLEALANPLASSAPASRPELPQNLTEEDRNYLDARLRGRSDKQFAEENGLKIETIAQRRYRIAQRLGLDADTDIETFLLRLTGNLGGDSGQGSDSQQSENVTRPLLKKAVPRG